MFARIFEGLAAEATDRKTIMIDATFLKSLPHAVEPAVEGGEAKPSLQCSRASPPNGRLIGRTKGGMNSKLHTVTDTHGRRIRFFMTAGQVSDYTSAAALRSTPPTADWPLAARGYVADWLRAATLFFWL